MSAKPGLRKVDVRLPGRGNSNLHGARPVHLINTMIKWIRTSRLSIKNSLSDGDHRLEVRRGPQLHRHDLRGGPRPFHQKSTRPLAINLSALFSHVTPQNLGRTKPSQSAVWHTRGRTGTPSSPSTGFRVWGSGFRVRGSGFRIQGSGLRVQGSGFRVQGSGFRVQGSGFRVLGLGFSVHTFQIRVSMGEGTRASEIYRQGGRDSPRDPTARTPPLPLLVPNHFQERAFDLVSLTAIARWRARIS